MTLFQYIYTIYHQIDDRIKYWYYKNRQESLIERMPRNHMPIKVVFFVNDLSMWKNEALFQLLLKDSTRFTPIIISFILPSNTRQTIVRVQNSLSDYCSQHGFPYVNMYDEENDCLLDIKQISPDIVFYSQPYNAGYKQYRIEKLWKHSIFVYSPYCLLMENEKRFYDTLLLNLAWRDFVPTKYHYIESQKLKFNHARNSVIVGHPLFEILTEERPEKKLWKDGNSKRIIWAPHHTIYGSDLLHYGTFLRYYDFMLDLANRYNDRIQIAFKPHPALKERLYMHPEWGKERTDDYYEKWDNMPNSFVADGEYVDLFRSSDAMIHDCSSFIGEYLAINKPILFLDNELDTGILNSFGSACFELNYKGSNVDSIEAFINDIVLCGNDPLEEKRRSFINELYNPQSPPSRNMYEQLVSIFK